MKISLLVDFGAALFERWFAMRANFYIRTILTVAKDPQDTEPWDRPYLDLAEDRTLCVSPHPRGSLKRLGAGDV